MPTKSYLRQLDPPNTSFFLLGPRGTGKTTYLKQIEWSKTTISLLEQRRYQSLLANPTLLYDELSVLPMNSKVVVDEIQRIPELLNEIHRLIEDRRLKFALTGSSARKLRRASTNLLAGRAVLRYMFPLTPQEMGSDYNVEHALTLGTLPLVVSSETPTETLEAYVHLYLREEIQAEALVRALAGFVRFLPIAATLHGQVVNLSNVARESEVQRPTVQGYFSILEDTLLVRLLPGYESKLRVRERHKPKVYFVDAGIVRACQKRRGHLAPEERGPLFEGLIFNLLVTQKETFRHIDELHYWSPAEAKFTEVDFLVSKGSDKIAIEAKASDLVRPDHLRGLKAIADLKGLKRRILVYTGQVRRRSEGIEILPFKYFVEELANQRI